MKAELLEEIKRLAEERYQDGQLSASMLSEEQLEKALIKLAREAHVNGASPWVEKLEKIGEEVEVSRNIYRDKANHYKDKIDFLSVSHYYDGKATACTQILSIIDKHLKQP
jgi:hypothetical protein